MTKQVELEDGSVHEFPDDATEEEINSALPPVGLDAQGVGQGAINDPDNQTAAENAQNPMMNDFGGKTALVQRALSNNEKSKFKDYGDAIHGALGLEAGIGASELTIPKMISEHLPSMATGLANMGTRIGASAGIGGTVDASSDAPGTWQDKFKSGAENGAGWAAGAEVLGLPFRVLRSAAEAIHPQEFANKLAGEIKDTYQTYDDKAKGIWKSLMKNHADTDMETSAYKEQAKKSKEYYNDDITDLHKTFMKNPNYENAQALQKQIGAYWKRLNKGTNTDPVKENTLSALTKARQAIIDTDMKNTFEKIGGNDFAKYQTARGITRDILKPVEEIPSMNIIAKGRSEGITPDKLENELRKARESGKLKNNGHYLNDIYERMAERNQKAKIAQYVIPTILGGAVGGLGGHAAGGLGDLGGIGGSLAGTVAGHVASPTAAKWVQTPLLEHYFANAKRGLYGAGQGLSAYTNDNS